MKSISSCSHCGVDASISSGGGGCAWCSNPVGTCDLCGLRLTPDIVSWDDAGCSVDCDDKMLPPEARMPEMLTPHRGPRARQPTRRPMQSISHQRPRPHPSSKQDLLF